ncbi:MAG: hydrogenase maturation protease [Anaerolinea sp.]|nr:hydrogenase maturation protease [Anaerolinea sp.]
MKTLIVGLGNPILTDDGVGVRVAYEVEKALHATPSSMADVHVTEASVGGLRLMEMMVGYDRAIIVDALMEQNGAPPGVVQRLTLADLRAISPTQHSASAHDTTLITALDSGREMGLHLPQEVVIYAITVANVLDFSEEMTPAVAAAVPKVVTAVLAELTSSPGC